MKTRILIGLVVLFILLQLIPSPLPVVRQENPKDLLKNNDIPAEIAGLLRTSCYDCHSNETRYPWYSYVAPVSWLVRRDTHEGREHLNFSDWQGLDKPQVSSSWPFWLLPVVVQSNRLKQPIRAI